MSCLVFSLAGNLKCTSGQALRQGWKVCCACMLFQLTSWGWKQEQCIFLQPYFTSHGWSCVFFVLLVWRPVSVSLCFLAVSSANLDEKTASAVTLLQQIINMQNQVGGKWLFVWVFWGCCFLFCFFAWTKPTCRSNGILNKLFYLQWQRSNRVWIVLPVLLSLHR